MASSSSSDDLDENTVRYTLFPDPKHQTSPHDLDLFLIDAMAKLNPFLNGFIWQNEPFNLRVIPTSPSFNGGFIQGISNFGHNVDDEWFIVFLLMQLTSMDPQLVVKIEDNDGDFLLIEGADFLPRWINPDTAVNRVFIAQGSIHIVPKKMGPLPSGVPSLNEAIHVVRSPKYQTACDQSLMSIISKRVKAVAPKGSPHIARCYVPAAVAAIVRAQPDLVAGAIRSFATRDITDNRVIRTMKYFPPENRVMTNVRMTRCLYAQLMSTDYKPDPKVGWDIPSAKGHPLFKSYDLGMKLACGFELLIASSEKKTRSKDKVTSIDVPDDDVRWQRFIRSLYKNGYFQSATKGSKPYNDLLVAARSYFHNTIIPMTSSPHGHGDVHVLTSNVFLGNKCLDLLRSLDIDYDKWKEEEKILKKEDSDRWYHVTPEDFDSFLKDKFLSPVANLNLKDMSVSLPKAISRFVQQESGFDGVDVPPPLPPPRDRNGHSMASTGTSKSPVAPSRAHTTSAASRTKSPVTLSGKSSSASNNKSTDQEGDGVMDPDNFMHALRSILTLKVPSDPEPSSSDMSDYSDEVDTDSDESYGFPKDELHFLNNNRNSRSSPIKSKGSSGSPASPDGMKSYMKQMDRELASTTMGHSFDKPPLAKGEEDDMDGGDGDDGDDFNTLKNILTSYKSQDGMPGPSTTLLHSMGMFIPKDKDRGSFK